MRAPPPPGAPPRRSSPTQKPVVSQRATGGAGVPAQKAQPRSSAPDAPVLAAPLGLSQGRLRGRHRNSSLSHAPLHVRLLRDGEHPHALTQTSSYVDSAELKAKGAGDRRCAAQQRALTRGAGPRVRRGTHASTARRVLTRVQRQFSTWYWDPWMSQGKD